MPVTVFGTDIHDEMLYRVRHPSTLCLTRDSRSHVRVSALTSAGMVENRAHWHPQRSHPSMSKHLTAFTQDHSATSERITVLVIATSAPLTAAITRAQPSVSVRARRWNILARVCPSVLYYTRVSHRIQYTC